MYRQDTGRQEGEQLQLLKEQARDVEPGRPGLTCQRNPTPLTTSPCAKG